MTRIALALLVAFLDPGCSVLKLQSNARATPHIVLPAHRAIGGIETLAGIIFNAILDAQAVEGENFDPRNRDQAEAAILSEIRRLRATGVTEAERKRALTVAEARRAASAADVTRGARRDLANPTTVVVRPPA